MNDTSDRVANIWSSWDRRRRALAMIVVASVLMGIGGFAATLVIDSPSESAASAEAPDPSLITVPVERRQVGEEIVTRGQVTATQTVEAISSSAGQNSARAIVSGHVPSAGDAIDHGGLVIEISGRPIFALQAEVPAYRDLNPGDQGPDVQRLNGALAAAGLGAAAESTVYDSATESAVDALYGRSGYVSPGYLPAAEVVFVSGVPATIVAVTATLGAEVAASSVTIASGQLTVKADVPSAQRSLVQDGAKAVLSSELLGESVDATVQMSAVGADQGAAPTAGGQESAGDTNEGDESPTTEGSPSETTDPDAGLVVVPDEPLPSMWAGQDVRVRIVSAATKDKVLAVPVTAVVANAQGETEVVVVAKDASSIANAKPRRVRVDAGVTGGGWAEITPADGAKLEEGDVVQLSAPLEDDK